MVKRAVKKLILKSKTKRLLSEVSLRHWGEGWLPAIIMLLGLPVMTQFSTASATACDPKNDSFVCGVFNAEDLVRLPGTRWVIASYFNVAVSMQDENDFDFGYGPLQAVRTDTHDVRWLYPTTSSRISWDRKRFPDCPAPPLRMTSHGLNVRALGAHRFRLYVANNGERNSVEIIDVAANGEDLIGTWRGCVLAPDYIWPNGVVPLPDGRIALSGWGVGIWTPGHGWSPLQGISELRDGNGIEVSPDGRWLFVNLYRKGQIVRVPVGGGEPRVILKDDIHPDNLRWGQDGYLYASGFPDAGAETPCRRKRLPVCDAAFSIVKIDTATLTAKDVYQSRGMKGEFGLASTALQVEDGFWAGSFIGNRIAVIKIKSP